MDSYKVVPDIESPSGRDIDLKDSREQQVLTFLLGEVEYGVDIHAVQEIRSWAEPTSLPGANDYVAGVINLRGIIVPLLDLRLRFSLEYRPYTAVTVVIVLNITTALGDRTVGIIVDSVSDVLSFSDDELKDTPSMTNETVSVFVASLAARDDHMVVILDLNKVMDEELLRDMAESEQPILNDGN